MSGQVAIGRTAYEVVAQGCATGWDKCPNGDRAVTAYELDKSGNRRYPNLTVCIKDGE